MDSLAALALATELPKPSLLQRQPQNRNDYIVSRKMIKHILYMALYQCIVLFFILFAGEYFIPESDVALQYDRPTGYVYPGRLYNWDGSELYKKYESDGASRHLTIVFNTFVWMQIFNMIAARKIHDEFNIFEGIFTNIMFLIIFVVIAAGQFVITQYGSYMFVVNVNGLDAVQWGISIGFGMSVYIINAILKCIPDWLTPSLGNDSVFNARYPAHATVQKVEDE